MTGRGSALRLQILCWRRQIQEPIIQSSDRQILPRLILEHDSWVHVLVDFGLAGDLWVDRAEDLPVQQDLLFIKTALGVMILLIQ